MSEKSIVEQIKHYQRDIIKCPDNEKRMIRCIERLMVLPVTITHLQETGVGRSVNELRKCGGEVGAAANALVCKWKSMVQAEEDSEVESDVDESEPMETQQVSSPDQKVSSPQKYESVEKTKNAHNSEELKKSKSDYNSSKKIESSHSENRISKSSDQKYSDKYDHKSPREKSSLKAEHSSGSDSKHSSNHRSRSDYDARSNKKHHSSQRSESEYNGDVKTEKISSKVKSDESKTSSKSSSSERRSKDIKPKYDKVKHQREDSSHRNDKENRKREDSTQRSSSNTSPKKYDIKRIESDSSDDDTVYKPRSKKRKKSESDEGEKYKNDKYKGRDKHKDSNKKRHESSEESDAKSGSDDDENSRPSSRFAESSNESENEDEISHRSSANDNSDNDSESDVRGSSEEPENEESQSEKGSGSEENDNSPDREIYVPVKIKREKESPPRHYKPSDKNKSSHSKSSHSSSHKSSSHSKADKEAVTVKSEKRIENTKIKKEKEKEDVNSKKHKVDKSSDDKKNHKSSRPSSHSDSSNKQGNKTDKKVKVKIEKEDDGSIDCVSGASFADALMGLAEPKKKTAKRKSTTSTPEKSFKAVEKPSEGKSKIFSKSESRSSTSYSSSSKPTFKEPELLSTNVKLEPLDVDLKSTLPEISPNYKPLPHYSPPTSPPGKRTKLLSQEEALSTIMSTKNQRTKVYSGNKTGYLKVPSLFDLCIQVLRDNIEALEYTGGVPYDLLKPVLDRATAVQLFQLEHYNPYLVEDTDGLWKFHCNKDFRGKEPEEFETWRELYVRLLDERERKLEALKANITQSMAKNTPVRQTKLAYVDSVVKPPRNIAKKQMKFGTGKAVKHDLVSKAMVGAASSTPAPPAVPVPAPSRPSHSNNSFPIPNFLKKKKAPLMQKTLQLIKGNRFKR